MKQLKCFSLGARPHEHAHAPVAELLMTARDKQQREFLAKLSALCNEYKMRPAAGFAEEKSLDFCLNGEMRIFSGELYWQDLE